MDPVTLATLGVTAIGLGTSLFGSSKASSDSKRAAQLGQQYAAQSIQFFDQSQAVSNDITQNNYQQNDVRRQAMNLMNSRQQLEILRTSQRARAMALQAGVSQGAQYGSGVAGGIAQAKDQANWGLLGGSQQTQLGNQMFNLDNSLTGLRANMTQIQTNANIAKATYEGQMTGIQGNIASDQGLMSLGGSIMKAGPMIGPLASGLGGLGSSLGSGAFSLFGPSGGVTGWTSR